MKKVSYGMCNSRVVKYVPLTIASTRTECPTIVIVSSLIALLVFSGCSPNRVITRAQLQKDEEHYSRSIGKRVDVHRQNQEVISGYLHEVEADSIAIILGKRNGPQTKISKHEIDHIVVILEMKTGTKIAICGAILAAGYLLHEMAEGLGAGISATR